MNIWKWFTVIQLTVLEINRLKNLWKLHILKNQVKYLIKTCARFTRGGSKLRGCSWFSKLCLAKLDLVTILLFKRKPTSSLVSFQKLCQVTCHLFHATTVCKKVMLLRPVMLENDVPKGLWNGSQKDLERCNPDGPNLSKGTK